MGLVIPYTAEEDKIIEDNYGILSAEKIALLCTESSKVQRTAKGVKGRAVRKKFKSKAQSMFTPEQDNFLINYYAEYTSVELYEAFEGTEITYDQMRSRIEILKRKPENKEKMKKANLPDELPEGHAWCSSCKEILPVENFVKLKAGKTTNNGYHSYCRPCDSIRKRKKTAEKKAKDLKMKQAREKYYALGKTTVCRKCNKEKRNTEFELITSKNNISLSLVCRACRFEKSQINRANRISQGKEW